MAERAAVTSPQAPTEASSSPRAWGRRSRGADCGRGPRESRSCGRERRAALDRAGVRRVADGAQSGRGRLLGLAASVLYFGAVGDRYGRKLLLIVGMVVTVPADRLAAWAPSIDVPFGARVLGGLAAGMAYPTTLAPITALWSGPARTKSIALWAATGGAISALGPVCAGHLPQHARALSDDRRGARSRDRGRPPGRRRDRLQGRIFA
jgi:Major Facilitator Superfamily